MDSLNSSNRYSSDSNNVLLNALVEVVFSNTVFAKRFCWRKDRDISLADLKCKERWDENGTNC